MVGKIVKNNLRGSDIGCRYGGDEFALILPHTSLDEIDILTSRLIDGFKA